MKEVYLVMIGSDSYNPIHTEINEIGSKVIFSTLQQAQDYLKNYPYGKDCWNIFRINIENCSISLANLEPVEYIETY